VECGWCFYPRGRRKNANSVRLFIYRCREGKGLGESEEREKKGGCQKIPVAGKGRNLTLYTKQGRGGSSDADRQGRGVWGGGGERGFPSSLRKTLLYRTVRGGEEL